MFGIHRKLRAWERAGLLTAEQARALGDYERTRQGGRFARGLTGLAVFAILAGVLMMIGANWNAIPAAVKLLVHAALNIGVACAVWRFDADGRDTWREGCALALCGLTLTFFALVGQVYHLNGGPGGLLALWLAVCAPFMMVYGRTMLAAIPFVLAFLGCMPVIVMQYVEHFPDIWQVFYSLMLMLLLPLAMIADGQTFTLRAWRPDWAAVFTRAGFILLTLSGVAGTFLWYVGLGSEIGAVARNSDMSVSAAQAVLAGVPLAALAGLGVHFVLYRDRVADAGFYRAVLAYCVLCVVMCALPFVVLAGESSLMAAVSFCVFWLGAGWFGHATGAMRLVSLSITMIGLRIYVVFLEAFGGLMMTGIGMVLAGAGMLGMIWGLRRLTRYVRSLPAAGPGTGVAS